MSGRKRVKRGWALTTFASSFRRARRWAVLFSMNRSGERIRVRQLQAGSHADDGGTSIEYEIDFDRFDAEADEHSAHGVCAGGAHIAKRPDQHLGCS
jgi:hypothetical protein